MPPLIMLVFWLALMAASIYVFIFFFGMELKERYLIRKRGVKTLAEVIDYNVEKDADDVTLYLPILKFTSQYGEDVVVVSNASVLEKYEDGKRLPVFYMNEDPKKFYVIGTAPYYILLPFFGIPIICLLLYFIIDLIRSLL